MSTRVPWATVAVGLAFAVIVLVALIVGNDRSPKTWTVQPGVTLTLSSDRTDPDDLYRCPGKGAIASSPSPGHVAAASVGGISVRTDPDGTVTVACEPGP